MTGAIPSFTVCSIWMAYICWRRNSAIRESAISKHGFCLWLISLIFQYQLYISTECSRFVYSVKSGLWPWDFRPTGLAVTLSTCRAEQKHALSQKFNLERWSVSPPPSTPLSFGQCGKHQNNCTEAQRQMLQEVSAARTVYKRGELRKVHIDCFWIPDLKCDQISNHVLKLHKGNKIQLISL